MRRRFGYGLAVLATVVALAACGGDAKNPSANGVSADNAVVTVQEEVAEATEDATEDATQPAVENSSEDVATASEEEIVTQDNTETEDEAEVSTTTDNSTAENSESAEEEMDVEAALLAAGAEATAAAGVVTTVPQVPTQIDAAAGLYRSELTGEWISIALQNQRPIAVMVDNEKVALPHYGVNSADIVYELMNSTANGRITRLMVVIKDWQSITQLGSIRSVRPTNFWLAAEYNAILCHDGGPYYINQYVARDYCDNLSGGFARFSNGKRSEFTEYITFNNYTNPNTGRSYAGLGQRIASAGYSTTYNEYYPGDHLIFDYEGVNLAQYSTSFAATTVMMPFPHNQSCLYYNANTGTYDYYEYGMAHIDPLDNNAVTSFKNVIIQDCAFEQFDTHGYMAFYAIAANQPGYYLTEGRAIPIIWSKMSETSPTIYVNAETGQVINLNVGKTYIGFVPSDQWTQLVIQ